MSFQLTPHWLHLWRIKIKILFIKKMFTENTVELQKDIHHVTTEWQDKMHFASLVNDHIIHFDKLEIHGGQDRGSRPKQVMLSALAGCTGMEIISILEKMRIKIEGLEIDIKGELNDGQPKIYKSIHILFKIKCEYADRSKIERAIQLADKYCGVLAMFKKFAKTTSEVQFM